MHTGQISIFLPEKTKQSTQDTPDTLGDVNYPEFDPSLWIYAAKAQLWLWLCHTGEEFPITSLKPPEKLTSP